MTADQSPDASGREVDRLRASHEDRDRVIDVLRIAAGDGRLTAGELDERLEIAFSARTHGELAALTADLPAAGSGPAAKDIVRIDCSSGHASRDGRWIVPRRMEIRLTSGQVKLDFSQAVIVNPELDIDVDVRSGHVQIITRPGIWVDADDVATRSGVITNRAPWRDDVPAILHISVSGQVGSGLIAARPPRRSLWQWLLSRPIQKAGLPRLLSRAGSPPAGWLP